MNTRMYSTYRGRKLEDYEQRTLAYWPNKKEREETIKFCLEGISRKAFDKTFMGILEKDRLEAEKNGKSWPEDFL